MAMADGPPLRLSGDGRANPEQTEPVCDDGFGVHALAAFDDLRQGIRDIELLDDPYAGELTIGCP